MSTKPCEFCGKPTPQVEGRRPKKFCSNTCRQKKWAGERKSGKPPGRPKNESLPNPVPYPIETKILPVHIPSGVNLLRGFMPAIIYDVNGKAMTDEEIVAATNTLADKSSNGPTMIEQADPYVESATKSFIKIHTAIHQEADKRKVVNPDADKTKQMKEPKEGSNAFFMRYGAFYKKDIPK
jgi:hypothetical protein